MPDVHMSGKGLQMAWRSMLEMHDRTTRYTSATLLVLQGVEAGLRVRILAH